MKSPILENFVTENKMRLPSVSVNQCGADKPGRRAAEWPEGGSISRLQTGVEDFGEHFSKTDDIYILLAKS